jgi:hypothetical protein
MMISPATSRGAGDRALDHGAARDSRGRVALSADASVSFITGVKKALGMNNRA